VTTGAFEKNIRRDNMVVISVGFLMNLSDNVYSNACGKPSRFARLWDSPALAAWKLDRKIHMLSVRMGTERRPPA
jgi:hypothetical protein